MRRCDFPRLTPAAAVVAQVEREEAARLHVPVVDLSPEFCDGGVCGAMRDGRVRYIDDSHLTASFAETLAPIIAEALHL
jgi:hypothetical protein